MVPPISERHVATASVAVPEVSLQEITASTVRAVTDLQVAPEQESYVASNAVSIAQAYFHREAWFRSIHKGDELIGFVMLRDSTLLTPAPAPAELSLWRFMIDRRFQKAGLGRKALALVVAYARTRPGVTAIHTSYVVGPTGQWSSTYHSAFATLAKSNQMARSPLSLSWLRTKTRSIEFGAFPGSGLTFHRAML